MLMVTLMISALQQLCGVDVILYYAPIILEDGGIRSRLAQLALTALAGLAKVGVLFVTMHYLDHKSAGRRPLMLLSFGILAASTTMVAIGFGVNSLPVMVIGIMIFCGGFSVGAGPICWLMNSEVLPLSVRARGMTLGCSINRLCSAVLQTVFLSMAEGITNSGAFMVLTAINAFGFVYLFFYMPETKGKSLEEMTAYFAGIIGVEYNTQVGKDGARKGRSDSVEMKGMGGAAASPRGGASEAKQLGDDSVIDADRNDSVAGGAPAEIGDGGRSSIDNFDAVGLNDGDDNEESHV